MGTLAELSKRLTSVVSNADLRDVMKSISEAQVAEKESIQNLKQCLEAAKLLAPPSLVLSPQNESLKQVLNEATLLSPSNQVLSPCEQNMEAAKQETRPAMLALKIENEALKADNIALKSMKQGMEATIFALRSDNEALLLVNHALKLEKQQAEVCLQSSSKSKKAVQKHLEAIVADSERIRQAHAKYVDPCDCMLDDLQHLAQKCLFLLQEACEFVTKGGTDVETMLVDEEIMLEASGETAKVKHWQSSSDFLGSDVSTDLESDSGKPQALSPMTSDHQDHEVLDVDGRVMSLTQLTFNRAIVPKYSAGTIVAPNPTLRVTGDTFDLLNRVHVLNHQIQKMEDTTKKINFRPPYSTPLQVLPCPLQIFTPRPFS